MPVGGQVTKDDKINDFITNVINPAIARIQKDKADLGVAASAPTPVVNKTDLSVNPGTFGFNGTNPSAVNTKGGELTAAALADLFISYAHKLTSIRRSTLIHHLIQTNSSGHLSYTTTNVWSAQVTALSAEYALPPATFKTRVEATSNPLTALQPGQPASLTAIDALITKLNSVLATRSTEGIGTMTVYSCHSSCHSSCHGSRGRR
jgi:hypothetical protein